VTCPKCSANVKINRDGTIRVHRDPHPNGPVCAGSRWHPNALRKYIRDGDSDSGIDKDPVVRCERLERENAALRERPLETTIQHIARDIREGRFPQKSEPLAQARGVTDEDDDTLIDNLLWSYGTDEMPRYDEFRAELKRRLERPSAAKCRKCGEPL